MLIATTNAKGGVGKSTIAAHLVAHLDEQGVGVALIDADVQRSSAQWVAEAAPDVPVLPVSSPDEILGQQVADLIDAHEVVVADGPAGLAEVSRALLLIADLAIIPCGPSVLDLRAAAQAVAVLGQAQRVRGGKPEGLLVLNRMQGRTRLAQEVSDAASGLGLRVAAASLSLRTAFADAGGQGSVVWRLGAPGAAAAEEVLALNAEILETARTLNP